MHLRSIFAAALLATASFAAHADSILTGTFNVSVHEGTSNGTSTPGQQFNATSTDPYGLNNASNTAYATFTYTGPLNFVNKTAQNGPGTTGDLNSAFFNVGSITNYNGFGSVSYNGMTVANFGSLSSFLASSGSASGFAYGSYYSIDLGTLSTGTVLTITHDDGASVYQNGTKIGGMTSGATPAVTEKVTLGSTANTRLYYGRENGTPSILTVNTSVTPEPSSIALLGTGLASVAGVIRKRKKSA